MCLHLICLPICPCLAYLKSSNFSFDLIIVLQRQSGYVRSRQSYRVSGQKYNNLTTTTTHPPPTTRHPPPATRHPPPPPILCVFTGGSSGDEPDGPPQGHQACHGPRGDRSVGHQQAHLHQGGGGAGRDHLSQQVCTFGCLLLMRAYAVLSIISLLVLCFSLLFCGVCFVASDDHVCLPMLSVGDVCPLPCVFCPLFCVCRAFTCVFCQLLACRIHYPWYAWVSMHSL